MEKFPYSYTNSTRQIQIVRVQINFDIWIERAVLPEKIFTFTAPSHAQLEIYTYAFVTSVLSDRIPCQQLLEQTMSLILDDV